MNAADIQSLIENAIAGAEVLVDGMGDRFDICVISDSFQGLTPVKRQQSVYACIRPLLDAGHIHAVNLQTWTRAQWQAAHGASDHA